MRSLLTLISSILPNSIRDQFRTKIWALTDWVSFRSYSGEGEDMILRKIFTNKEKGFYVDVGAYHPKKLSNTYYFYKKGWNGINIDAMPGSMKLFDQLRKRDINLEIPIGKDGEDVYYYEFKDKALNGFESDHLKNKNQTKPQNQLLEVHKMKCNSLDTILRSYLPNGQEIDFLSIDVEGQEMKILQFLDFSTYKPTWLLVEIWDYDCHDNRRNEIVNFLYEKGYTVKAKTLNTVFFKNISK
ncbi:FkbM family methyltransferase [Algoriphagus lacus]|uniref:FkbM family methyltransferase n=1 Tax=Algoriphagus lacus TaxID=2056311 RepID=A0A418PLM7_9BACT|nr:FkbM family methyltransferase [Algoriphagus lacus]RIW12283.1 FkbM family methyltransferase [Algoriphagus lacus]